jgi:hypothetical protein
MDMVALTFCVVLAALAAILTRPANRDAIRAAFDPASPLAVAGTICQAEADVGRAVYEQCMHRALPDLPAPWPNMPGQR